MAAMAWHTRSPSMTRQSLARVERPEETTATREHSEAILAASDPGDLQKSRDLAAVDAAAAAPAGG